jgi:hypothetical protein
MHDQNKLRYLHRFSAAGCHGLMEEKLPRGSSDCFSGALPPPKGRCAWVSIRLCLEADHFLFDFDGPQHGRV